MNRHTKTITVAGQDYTLTAKRDLVVKLGEICPEVLSIAENKNSNELSNIFRVGAGIKLIVNMNTLFYDMIKVAHPQLTIEESDDIYEQFCKEYNNVEINLIRFIKSVFTDGIPREKKKNLDW